MCGNTTGIRVEKTGFLDLRKVEFWTLKAARSPFSFTQSFYKRVLSVITTTYYAGRDLGQEEKGITEDEMAGWHH